MKKIIIFSIITFVIMFVVASYLNNDKRKDEKIIIVSSGSGGDKNASIIIDEYLNNKGVDSVICDLSEIKNYKKYKTYLVIGQASVADFINNRDFFGKNVFLYSHILSNKMIDFVKNNKVKMLVTEAEYNLHKNELDKSKILTIPLALPTYLPSKSKIIYDENKQIIEIIFENPIIHLGGSYKDANGNDVAIKDDNFAKVKDRLNIKNTDKVSIITHPRTFMDIKNNPELIKDRFIAIATKDGLSNSKFFVSKDIYDLVQNNKDIFTGINVFQSPPYNGILYAINEISMKQQHFISVDQYNAFADIRVRVDGFLLNEDDESQSNYLYQYNKTDINSDLLRQLLKLKEEIKITNDK
jgi:hypothetical protein